MNFEESRPEGVLLAEISGEGRLKIGQNEHTAPVALIGGHCLPLEIARAEEITADTFAPYFSEYGRPEVILVGTGSRQIFLHPKTGAALAAQGIGLESMSTAAACRTHLLLQSEGRSVWAWLWP